MSMENSSLNKAHQQQRRAEALLRQRKFEDCIECHKKAAELLMDATKLTENQRALESLRLQLEYHRKQIDLVGLKRIEQEQHKRAAEDQKRKEELLESEDGDGISLEAVFYRTFQVHDSLIDYLGKRGTGSDNDSLKSYSTSDTEEKTERDGVAQVIGNKHPKDDAQIIEELKMLSDKLRGTVQRLLGELDDRNKEIDKLKDKISLLEAEKEKALALANSSGLKVVTDSSGGTSPYVFSPCSELSPDVLHHTSLPPLPPLEMPNLDFLNLIKNNK